MTREQADKVSQDPRANDFSEAELRDSLNRKISPVGRYRNRRGQYQSIDISNKLRSGPNLGISARSGSKQEESPPLYNDIYRAEHRLRVIEKISKYREEKVKREFIRLEQELREEDEAKRKQLERQRKVQEYFKHQKMKLEEYQRQKQDDHPN